MKIIFITPAADLRRNFLHRLGGQLYGQTNAITGPLVLGHILKDAGHQVEVYEELYTNLNYRTMTADVFCINVMTSTAPRAYKIADQLRAQGAQHIIIGGIHASALPDEALAHADQIVVGEAETVIVDVVEGRLNEKIVQAPCPQDLDKLPFPDYSLLKTPVKAANVISSRGCTHCCSFCTTSRMFAPYRKRSVESVIEELRYYKQLGFKYMNFEDDNFTADKERTKEICRRMIAEGLVFKESFFFGRTDLAQDEEMLSLLAQAHLTRVLVGIESLNQEALDSIDKKQQITDIEKCAKALERHKIRLIASIVLGLDTDDHDDMQNAVNFCKRINAYQLQPAILTPYPGTPVYQEFKEQDRILNIDWDVYDMINVTFIPKHLSPWQLQLEFFHAIASFYSFSSAFKIMRTFGLSYGLRRLGMWVMFSLGALAGPLLGRFVKISHFYYLYHLQEQTRASFLPELTPELLSETAAELMPDQEEQVSETVSHS